jgi:hypothetical protein
MTRRMRERLEGPALAGIGARILGVAAACAVGGGLLALAAPSAAAAQAGGRATDAAGARALPPAAIPVVERFDPATGRRTRYVAAPLGSGEALALQLALARAGFDPGVRSGSLDAATRSALAAFQRARRLEPCGCPSYAVVVALGLEPRVVETVIGGAEDAPSFAHATAGAAERVSPDREEGVVVVRGTGSEAAAAGETRSRAAGGEAGAGRAEAEGGAAAGAAPPAFGSSAWPAAGPWAWPSPFGFFLPRGAGRLGPGHGREGGKGRGPAGTEGARARPPIPYAPKLPEPRPAGPGLPPSPPPRSGSGGGATARSSGR